jgi:predicted metal-binding membrane protein
MAATDTAPLGRERVIILGALLGLSALGWAVLVWQARSMAAGMNDGMAMGGNDVPGLSGGMGGALFLAMWVTMMVAMMFPAAAPMILTFARISAGKRQKDQPFVPTWVFVCGYLAVWTVFGVVAYLVAVGAEGLAERSPWLVEHGARLGGVVFLLAGLYQLSPWKDTCLGKCRSPLAFILQSWRDGTGGALRMGLAHGLYCLGCCWVLFVLLFPLGIMNVAAMAVITLLVFAEKAWTLGRRLARVAAVALIAYGMLVIVVPNALPTML